MKSVNEVNKKSIYALANETVTKAYKVTGYICPQSKTIGKSSTKVIHTAYISDIMAG